MAETRLYRIVISSHTSSANSPYEAWIKRSLVNDVIHQIMSRIEYQGRLQKTLLTISWHFGAVAQVRWRRGFQRGSPTWWSRTVRCLDGLRLQFRDAGRSRNVWYGGKIGRWWWWMHLSIQLLDATLAANNKAKKYSAKTASQTTRRLHKPTNHRWLIICKSTAF